LKKIILLLDVMLLNVLNVLLTSPIKLMKLVVVYVLKRLLIILLLDVMLLLVLNVLLALLMKKMNHVVVFVLKSLFVNLNQLHMMNVL
jgi:hypothetical protein